MHDDPPLHVPHNSPKTNPDNHPDNHPETVSRNARVGLLLFAIYLALYATFVGLSAFAPTVMAKPVLAGVNLAVVYGFALIFAAMILALLYAFLCRDQVSSAADEGK